MNNDKTESQKEINSLATLFEKGHYKKGLELSKNLIKKYPDSPDVLFLNGIINLALNNYLNSIDSFSKSININKNNADAYNNKGAALYHLGNFNDSLEEFKQGLKLQPNNPIFLNNVGNSLNSLKKFDDALWYYNESLKFYKNYNLPILNTIRLLTHFDTKEINNVYIATNNKIRSLKYDFNINEVISDQKVITFFNEYIKLIPKELIEYDYKATEIFRRDKSLNCNRHEKIFNKFNTIPEFCFGCFKIQIETKNILDFIKLYIVFDKIKLSNNIRKCALETRINIPGSYKGLIYCSSTEEANKLSSFISEILKKAINNKVNIKIKRGCTEFAESYPNYAETNPTSNNFMHYDQAWKSNEKVVDENQSYKNKVFHSTLDGVTLSDILIIKNWIIYANYIGDNFINDLNSLNFKSAYISRQVSNQLDKRKSEFLKLQQSGLN
mgnify:CR=1 FL=1